MAEELPNNLEQAPRDRQPLTREQVADLNPGTVISFLDNESNTRVFGVVRENEKSKTEQRIEITKLVTDTQHLTPALEQYYKLLANLPNYSHVAKSPEELKGRFIDGYNKEDPEPDIRASLSYTTLFDYDRLADAEAKLADSRFSHIDAVAASRNLINWWSTIGKKKIEELAQRFRDNPEEPNLEKQAEELHKKFCQELVEEHISRTLAALQVAPNEVGWDLPVGNAPAVELPTQEAQQVSVDQAPKAPLKAAKPARGIAGFLKRIKTVEGLEDRPDNVSDPAETDSLEDVQKASDDFALIHGEPIDLIPVDDSAELQNEPDDLEEPKPSTPTNEDVLEKSDTPPTNKPVQDRQRVKGSGKFSALTERVSGKIQSSGRDIAERLHDRFGSNNFEFEGYIEDELIRIYSEYYKKPEANKDLISDADYAKISEAYDRAFLAESRRLKFTAKDEAGAKEYLANLEEGLRWKTKTQELLYLEQVAIIERDDAEYRNRAKDILTANLARWEAKGTYSNKQKASKDRMVAELKQQLVDLEANYKNAGANIQNVTERLDAAQLAYWQMNPDLILGTEKTETGELSSLTEEVKSLYQFCSAIGFTIPTDLIENHAGLGVDLNELKDLEGNPELLADKFMSVKKDFEKFKLDLLTQVAAFIRDSGLSLMPELTEEARANMQSRLTESAELEAEMRSGKSAREAWKNRDKYNRKVQQRELFIKIQPLLGTLAGVAVLGSLLFAIDQGEKRAESRLQDFRLKYAQSQGFDELVESNSSWQSLEGQGKTRQEIAEVMAARAAAHFIYFDGQPQGTANLLTHEEAERLYKELLLSSTVLGDSRFTQIVAPMIAGKETGEEGMKMLERASELVAASDQTEVSVAVKVVENNLAPELMSQIGLEELGEIESIEQDWNRLKAMIEGLNYMSSDNERLLLIDSQMSLLASELTARYQNLTSLGQRLVNHRLFRDMPGKDELVKSERGFEMSGIESQVESLRQAVQNRIARNRGRAA
jgi:hypothetical protein